MVTPKRKPARILLKQVGLTLREVRLDACKNKHSGREGRGEKVRGRGRRGGRCIPLYLGVETCMAGGAAEGPYIGDNSADAHFSSQAYDRGPDALLLGSLDAV